MSNPLFVLDFGTHTIKYGFKSCTNTFLLPQSDEVQNEPEIVRNDHNESIFIRPNTVHKAKSNYSFSGSKDTYVKRAFVPGSNLIMNYDVVEGTIDCCLGELYGCLNQNTKTKKSLKTKENQVEDLTKKTETADPITSDDLLKIEELLTTDSFSEFDLILTLGTSTPRLIKRDLLQVLMEVYNVKRVQFGIDSIYSYLYNQKRMKKYDKVFVVSSSHSETHLIEIKDLKENTFNSLDFNFLRKQEDSEKYPEKSSEKNSEKYSKKYPEKSFENHPETLKISSTPYAAFHASQYLNVLNQSTHPNTKRALQFKIKVPERSYKETAEKVLNSLSKGELWGLEGLKPTDVQKSDSLEELTEKLPEKRKAQGNRTGLKRFLHKKAALVKGEEEFHTVQNLKTDKSESQSGTSLKTSSEQTLTESEKTISEQENNSPETDLQEENDLQENNLQETDLQGIEQEEINSQENNPPENNPPENNPPENNPPETEKEETGDPSTDPATNAKSKMAYFSALYRYKVRIEKTISKMKRGNSFLLKMYNKLTDPQKYLNELKVSYRTLRLSIDKRKMLVKALEDKKSRESLVYNKVYNFHYTNLKDDELEIVKMIEQIDRIDDDERQLGNFLNEIFEMDAHFTEHLTVSEILDGVLLPQETLNLSGQEDLKDKSEGKSGENLKEKSGENLNEISDVKSGENLNENRKNKRKEFSNVKKEKNPKENIQKQNQFYTEIENLSVFRVGEAIFKPGVMECEYVGLTEMIEDCLNEYVRETNEVKSFRSRKNDFQKENTEKNGEENKNEEEENTKNKNKKFYFDYSHQFNVENDFFSDPQCFNSQSIPISSLPISSLPIRNSPIRNSPTSVCFFVTGGFTRVPGFVSRLTNEINANAPTQTKCDVVVANDPVLDTFNGAQFTHLFPTIERHTYESYGSQFFF